ncbi:hypothetical protein scyTo_0025763, partial [Scyliorhinus torazame]|nr:hypothetical protein [Scyliorhinus torazame]
FTIDEFGTLLIRDSVPEDAGSYACLASNSVGADRKEVKLKYSEVPVISVPNPVVLAVVVETALLECRTAGVPQPEVKWYKGIGNAIGETIKPAAVVRLAAESVARNLCQ